MGLGDGYRDGQRRTTTLLMTFDEDAFERIVPLNPLWRVRDVIAHEVGVSEEALAGTSPMLKIQSGVQTRPVAETNGPKLRSCGAMTRPCR
jgi:hypothetical protein